MSIAKIWRRLVFWRDLADTQKFSYGTEPTAIIQWDIYFLESQMFYWNKTIRHANEMFF